MSSTQLKLSPELASGVDEKSGASGVLLKEKREQGDSERKQIEMMMTKRGGSA
ncbi:hypothetical protein QCA50_015061 [Cerrena zonata]|uniref:Uncharacterized protein n=1 Tax=Cerrena zonata TaxID=2478898 RepID=A0AAW0FTY9_9APHY